MLLRDTLTGWHRAARTRRRLRDKRNSIERADNLRRVQLSVRHFVAWRSAWIVEASLRNAAATKHAVLTAWRDESVRRAELRLRLHERRRNAAAVAAVKAWQGWRVRTAVGLCAAGMRAAILLRFIAPVVTGWRIVTLAHAHKRLKGELRIAAAARHRMWSAWRVWLLGKAV